MRILALDIGSTSVKAGLWTGRTFSDRVRVPFPTHFAGDAAEIDPVTLLTAMMRAGDRVLTGAGAIDAIAYCTFSSGVVVTNLQGKPHTPIITHADRRSTAAALSLVNKRSKSWWLSRTGNLPYPGGIGSSTLAWLRQNQPALFRKPYRAGQVSSFIGSFLTGGAWLTDPSQAVFLGLWDIHRNKWNTDACKLVGVSADALPQCRWADESLGGLCSALAKRWNVTANVPVIGGFVDTSAAVIQTPMQSGQLAHNAGSTDVLALCIDHPHPAEGILTRPVGVSGNFSGAAGTPVWLAVRTIAAAGSALEWVRKTLYPEASEGSWRKLIAGTCRNLPQNVIDSVQCIPEFAGERASLIQPAGASFRGIRLGTARLDILESVVRALAVESAKNYSLLADIHPPQKIVYTMGGGIAPGKCHARTLARQAHLPAVVRRRLARPGLIGRADFAARAHHQPRPLSPRGRLRFSSNATGAIASAARVEGSGTSTTPGNSPCP